MMQSLRHAQPRQNELLAVSGTGSQRRELPHLMGIGPASRIHLPSPTVLGGRGAGGEGGSANLWASLSASCVRFMNPWKTCVDARQTAKPLTPSPSPRSTGARGAKTFAFCSVTTGVDTNAFRGRRTATNVLRVRSHLGRNGWTLIEMLVTVAVMAAITGIAVKTLAAMLRSERNGIEHVSRLQTVSRLARQFRSDIHAATAVELGADIPTKPLLLITVGDAHQIQYEKTPQGLLRTERRASQSARLEPWRLSQTEFQCVETPGTPRLLTLIVDTLEPGPNKGTAPASKEIRIDAVVGRDKL